MQYQEDFLEENCVQFSWTALQHESNASRLHMLMLCSAAPD